MCKSKSLIQVALILLFLSGCMAKVPLSTPELEATSKEFSPHGDRSLIYVYRITRGVGGGSIIQIQLDEKVMGSLANGTYFMFDVDPGKHNILFQHAIHSGNTVKVLGDMQATTLYTLPGQIYFLGCEITGVGVHIPDKELRLVSEEKGKSYVNQYRMAVSAAK